MVPRWVQRLITGTVLTRSTSKSFITSLAITPDGNLVASGSSSTDSLVLWDLQNYEPIVFISGDKLYKVHPACSSHVPPG